MSVRPSPLKSPVRAMTPGWLAQVGAAKFVGLQLPSPFDSSTGTEVHPLAGKSKRLKLRPSPLTYAVFSMTPRWLAQVGAAKFVVLQLPSPFDSSTGT